MAKAKPRIDSERTRLQELAGFVNKQLDRIGSDAIVTIHFYDAEGPIYSDICVNRKIMFERIPGTQQARQILNSMQFVLQAVEIQPPAVAITIKKGMVDNVITTAPIECVIVDYDTLQIKDDDADEVEAEEVAAIVKDRHWMNLYRDNPAYLAL